MSTTLVIKTTLVYADANTRTYTIPATSTITPAAAKAQIAAFNAAAATGTSDINKTFVSDTGQPVTMISEADLVRTTEEVIYSA